METAEYSEMYKLESFYWWFVARRRLLESITKSVVAQLDHPLMLDVGCGTGINHLVLAEFGQTYSTDLSEEALRYCRKRGVNSLVRCRVESLGFESQTFDLIAALDVLEHIDNDIGALEELWRVAKDDGFLIITVPAYGFLWSEHDEALHHRRRYAAYELRNKLARAGFEVERISYYIASLFFPIFAARILQNIFKKSAYPKTSHIILPKWLNAILIWILGFERLILNWINLPFGVSIVCLARKRKRQ